ncbi:MAG: MBL fold metallo-hydrolase [Chloroflexota bacterium]
MKIQITTLVENTAGGGCLAEHGLSVLLEADGKKILMDTGAGACILRNAQLRGVDLSAVDKIVISHGHYDHTGGLRDVLQVMHREVEVIAHPDMWAFKYGKRENSEPRYAGIPFNREGLESLGARFTLEREPVRITEHVMTTGEVPMVTGYEQVEGNLVVKEGNEFHPDPLADDLALVVDADFGLVVILGCAHRGIVNTLRHVRNITGKKEIYAAIGGTHLIRASEERIARTAADLKEMGVKKLGVSHCTGFYASAKLAQEFGDAFFLNNAGNHLTFPMSE